MKKYFLLFALLMLSGLAYSDDEKEVPAVITEQPFITVEEEKITLTSPDQIIPSRQETRLFSTTAPTYGALKLQGASPDGYLEFGVRSDEYVSQAILDLEFTPSPSLLPIESHLNIYLNDEIMGVIPLKKKISAIKTTLHYRSIHGLFKILII